MGQVSQETLERLNQERRIPKDSVLCAAPFNAMYLNTKGNLGACYASINHSPEEAYPKRTLKELWDGLHLKTIRKNVNKNVLDGPCHHCFREVENGNFRSATLNGFNAYPINPNGFPSIIDIETSNKCNLQCVMCRGELSSMIRKNVEKKPPLISPYDREFLEQLKEFIPHVTEMRFQGGETLLEPLNYEIWEAVIRLNPRARLSITTNCTIYSARFEEILRKIEVSLFLSIDALERKAYEKIRVNAKFEKTMRNAHKYIALSKSLGFQLTVCACPMTSNWKQIPLIRDFCNENGIGFWAHTVSTPTRLALRNLPPEKLRGIYEYLKGRALGPDAPTTVVANNNQVYLNFIENQVRAWSLGAQARSFVPC